MDKNSRNVTKAAARIIVQQGIEALNLNSLAKDQELKRMDISVLIKKEEDIFILLIDRLDEDIELLLCSSVNGSITPELELELLLKKAFELFQKKSWYLSVLYYNSIFEYNERIDIAFKEIQIKVADYLTKLIDKGKKENVYPPTKDTEFLMKQIFGNIIFSAVFVF